MLVELFQTCGKVELDFVIRSGLYLGFLLGVLQMFVWVCWYGNLESCVGLVLVIPILNLLPFSLISQMFC